MSDTQLSDEFLATPLGPEELPAQVQHLFDDPYGAAREFQRSLGPDVPDLTAGFLHNWLRWCLSGSEEAQMSWDYLSRKPEIDRDELALKLWRACSQDSPDSPIRRINKGYRPREYYEQTLFHWLLSRFNLTAARQVYVNSRVASALNGVILGIAVALDLLTFRLAPFRIRYTSISFIIFLALLGSVAIATSGRERTRGYAIAHSLIPRLAAGVALGYLFLAGAPHLTRIIYESQMDCRLLLLIDFMLLFFAFLYIWLHISRRIRPIPNPSSLRKRVCHIWLLGVAYAIALLLVAAPILFSGSLMYSSGAQPPASVPPAKLLMCASIALNLGVILQLIWDEKPLTEPL